MYVCTSWRILILILNLDSDDSDIQNYTDNTVTHILIDKTIPAYNKPFFFE